VRNLLLIFILCFVGCATAHRQPLIEFPTKPFFICNDNAALRHAELRMVSAGWGIAHTDEQYVQTDWRIVTSEATQLGSLRYRNGLEREELRLTVFSTAEGVRFRLDIRTTVHIMTVPPVVYHLNVQSLQTEAMDNDMRTRFNSVRYVVCGDRDFLPMRLDETPPIPQRGAPHAKVQPNGTNI